MDRKIASRATDEEALSSVARAEKQQHLQFRKRLLRYRLPRRQLPHISPLIILSNTAAADLSHSAAEVTAEVSCNSSVASVSNHKAPPLPSANFRYELRRLAIRSNYRNEISKFDEPLELSENSCVESYSGANDVRELFKLKSANVEESEAEGGGGEVSKSEVSSAPPRFPLAEKDVVRVSGNENSAVEIVRDDVVSKRNNNLLQNDSVSVDNSRDDVVSKSNNSILQNDSVSVDNSAVYCLDLACSEKFSNGAIIGDGDEEEEEEGQNSSSSGSFVEVLSDLEYTPSIWSYTSGSQFSEADEKWSPCFQLFSQFKQQLCRSTFSLAACANDCTSFEFTLLGLVDVEDEESYRMLMKRERRQVYLRDYAEEYCNTTDYGHLVIQQRLHIEQATTNKLQMETMFLGVSFLDRFLAKGYFKNIRHLQIAGIPCLALTPKTEEKQPYHFDAEKDDDYGGDDDTMWEEVNVGPGEEVNVGPGDDEGDEGDDDSDGEDEQYVCANCSIDGRVTVFSNFEPLWWTIYQVVYFVSMDNVNIGDLVRIRRFYGVRGAILTCTNCGAEVGEYLLWVDVEVDDDEEFDDDGEIDEYPEKYFPYRDRVKIYRYGRFFDF